MNQSTKALGIFSLAMITAVSVDSIRNLPATSLFGSSLIFFFCIAAVFFLLPSALISAELASTSKEPGGVYVWVKNAFGPRVGMVAIWFQWIENVIWYPTILSFVAGTIAYLISPDLASNRIFLISVILCAFWGATVINLMGIKSSAIFSNICALFGLILPMILIISMGTAWIFSGKPLQIQFTVSQILPQFNRADMWVALTGIILSFCGMEIATVHAHDVSRPQYAYPRAMLLATVIIVFTLICGALSIAIVLPEPKISLVAGIMQAFNAFFMAYHMHWILPVIAFMLVLGGMGSVSNWIIAPIRGLQIAFKDQGLFHHLQKNNHHDVPKYLLLYQAILVSIIAMVFFMLPTINASYWLLTALAAQLYMIMYFLMFLSGIRLRYKPDVPKNEGYRIPFGNVGMWVTAVLGMIGAVTTFIIGCIPPTNINIGGIEHYEIILTSGLFIMILPPFIIARGYRRRITD